MYSLFVIVWQFVIFCFSAHSADVSSSISGNLTKSVIKFFVPGIKEQVLNDISLSLSFIVRKSAHFVIFLILGILMYNAVTKSAKYKKNKTLFAFVFCVLYAVFDEVHQFFVPGRACRVFDIFVDTFGSITGIIGVILFKYIKSKK